MMHAKPITAGLGNDMKRLFGIVIALALAGVTGMAFAGDRYGYYDYGHRSYDRGYAYDRGYDRRDRSAAPIVGALIGGLIGNRASHGDGGATIAGAAIGYAIGRSADRDHRYRDRYDRGYGYDRGFGYGYDDGYYGRAGYYGDYRRSYRHDRRHDRRHRRYVGYYGY